MNDKRLAAAKARIEHWRNKAEAVTALAAMRHSLAMLRKAESDYNRMMTRVEAGISARESRISKAQHAACQQRIAFLSR